jgi:hypothetical protein
VYVRGMRRAGLVVLGAAIGLALSGCRGHGSAGAAVEPASGCNLASIGLGAARPAPAFDIPSGCSPRPGLDASPIRSEEAFHAALQCTAPSGVDFTRFELHVVMRTLSPAGLGTQVVDDGTTVTLVSLYRDPCPNEPPPMPMQVPVAYLLPAGAGAVRTAAERSCKVAWSCNR